MVHSLGHCLLFLFREREEAIKNGCRDIDENKNITKHDAIIPSSANETEQPGSEEYSTHDINAISDEEFESISMSEDSDEKRKLAELDERERLLRRQFEAENRITMEIIENIKNELRASQEKDTTINQEYEEIKMKYEELKEDMRSLDEAKMQLEKSVDIKAARSDEISENEERYLNDSWDALDDLKFPCCQSRKCSAYVSGCVISNDFDDSLLVQSVRRQEESKTEVVKSSEKLQELLEEVEERNKALKEIVHFTNKENEKLLDQVIAIKEEAKTIKMEKQILQTELEKVKGELKRLKASEQYKKRELTNLRYDIKKKVRKSEDMENSLDSVVADNKNLMHEAEALKDRLEGSEESNEELNFRIDELEVMIEELKTTTKLENNGQDYRYLREEVELLKGSLDLSKRKESMLECQLGRLLEDFDTFRGENIQIISNYQQQVLVLAKENSRMKNELSKLPDEGLKDEQTRVRNKLQVQLAALKKDDFNVHVNTAINADKLGCEEQFITAVLSEVEEEKTLVKKELQNQLVCLEREIFRTTAQLLKMSDKDNALKKLLGPTESLRNQPNNDPQEVLAAGEVDVTSQPLMVRRISHLNVAFITQVIAKPTKEICDRLKHCHLRLSLSAQIVAMSAPILSS